MQILTNRLRCGTMVSADEEQAHWCIVPTDEWVLISMFFLIKEFVMELPVIKLIGSIIAWSVVIVGYILMVMLAYHTVKRAMKGK